MANEKQQKAENTEKTKKTEKTEKKKDVQNQTNPARKTAPAARKSAPKSGNNPLLRLLKGRANQTEEPASLPSVAQLEGELDRAEYRTRFAQTLRSTVYVLIVTAAVVVLLAFLVFPVFRIYGSSMSPTVNEGELVVCLKGSEFNCGDVIVLSYNNKVLVKRVIAGPGEWFNIDLDGNVYVDGQLLHEPYLQDKAFGDCNIELPYQVPEGRYFVMGDNRSTSQDSRNSVVGCVAEEQILGRAIIRIWPLTAVGSLLNQ